MCEWSGNILQAVILSFSWHGSRTDYYWASSHLGAICSTVTRYKCERLNPVSVAGDTGAENNTS